MVSRRFLWFLNDSCGFCRIFELCRICMVFTQISWVFPPSHRLVHDIIPVSSRLSSKLVLFEEFSGKKQELTLFVYVWIDDRTTLVITDIPTRKIVAQIHRRPNLTPTSASDLTQLVQR